MTAPIARIALLALGCLASQGEPAQEPVRDAYGDPLPEGAVGRLGSIRLHHANRIVFVGDVYGPPTMITAAVDGSVRTWGDSSGAPDDFFAREGAIVSADLSPYVREDPLLALAGPDGAVEIRGVHGFDLLHRIEECGRFVRLAGGGSLLAATGLDESVRLVDVGTGEIRRTIFCGPYRTTVCAFPPVDMVSSSTTLGVVTVNRQKTLRRRGTGEQPSSGLHVLHPGSGETLFEVSMQSRVLTAVAFTLSQPILGEEEEGRGLVVAGDDEGGLHVWEVATGAKVHTMEGNGISVMGVEAADASNLVAAGYADGSIRVWDPATWEEIDSVRAGRQSVASLSWGWNNELFAAAGTRARIWDWAPSPDVDVDPNPEVLTEKAAYPRHSAPVSRIRFFAGGKKLISGGYDRSVRIWDVVSGDELVRFDGHEGFVYGLDVATDGSTFVTGGQDGVVHVWDAEGDDRKSLTGHSKAVTDVALSPNANTIASVSADRTVVLWSVESGEVLRRIEGLKGVTFSLLFSPDGERLVIGGSDLRILDAETGQIVYRMEGFGAMITALAVSPDGATFAVGLADRSIRLIDAAEGVETRALYGHGGRVTALAFAPDGTVLASASNNERGPRLWSVAPADIGAPLRRYEGHERDVMSLAFSPDGKVLAAGSMDGAILLWGVDSR